MTNTWLIRLILIALLMVTSADASDERVEILRDTWGIPHVFADTDAGAFYGLGYATAEDRAFQMTYSLRIVQGRLAEVVGEVRHLNRNDTSVDHDRKMRTFGFYRAAQRTAVHLDPETRDLLQAYCDGVNAYFREHREDLHPLFERLGLEPEPWTPADCLASWWHLAQFFGTDGTRDLIAGRSQAAGQTPGRGERGQPPARGEPRRTTPPNASGDRIPLPPDDATAIVKRSDVSAEWIERVLGYARQHGLDLPDSPGAEGPKFSHAWVVGGRRTTTGSAVLVSDPQTPVRNPSLLHQFHVHGATFNARGVGVAGSPVLLIGFTDRVAWGATALGADQADLFQLETDPARPNQYRFDGQWRTMEVYRETIFVKDSEPVELTVRETHLGPVATAFCFAAPGEPEVALKRIPICETDRETIQGAVAMMRARNVAEFDAALAGWRFPSANMVFGDREGNVGYRAVGAFPVRSRHDPSQGRVAQPGHRFDQDWQTILPYDLAPGVINPAAGCLFSGNHRPIESWYPLPLGAMTGAGGDTLRSWRLRECLEAKDSFAPEDVLAVHFDSVNPARRDIVRLGLHLRDVLRSEMSEDALRALAHLEPWYHAGASASLTEPGAELAIELNTFFRVGSTDLAMIYGGGESGLAYFLKTATARLDQDPGAELSGLEQHFIDQSLSGAWRSASEMYGRDPDTWNTLAREAVRQRRLGYYESLDGFPTPDRAEALALPALSRLDGGTLGCQTAQAYTQWVPLHDPDQALSILPIGQSERPDQASRTSTLDLWGESRLHPAPLTRAAVERFVESPRRTLIRERFDSPQIDDKALPIPSAPSLPEGRSPSAAGTAGVEPEVWLCAGDRIMELLQPGAEWPFVKQHLTGIKLYVGQLSGNRRESKEQTIERLRPLVRWIRAHQLQVAVELGGCLDFSSMDETAGEWSARHELAALANFYAAGGRVDFLDLDGPIRRLLHPENRRDGRRFDSIDEAADQLVEALKLHRAAHPETKYWLLTNFPNWGWRGDVSYHARGPQRQDYGDYDQVVRTVLEKLRVAEIPLDGVTVDNPYEYLVGEHFSVNLADPKSVDWLARVRSYEDFAREQGLTFNLIVNSQRGGQESDERFFRETLRMVDTYQRAGGRPTRWFVQSWYPHPKQMVPETASHSMTALVKAVIERVRREPPKSGSDVTRRPTASPAGRILLHPVQGKMVVAARVPHLGGQSFSLGIPETIGARERMILNFPEVDGKLTWTGPAKDGSVASQWTSEEVVHYHVRLVPGEDFVDIEMTVQNLSADTWRDVFAFNCLNPTGASGFHDWKLERTYMSSHGKPLLMAKTRRVRGHMPTVGFYTHEQTPWGHESSFVRGFSATSPNRTDDSWIVTISEDGRSHMAATSQDALFLFDNLDRCCIHSATSFGEIGPNEKSSTVARLYLAQGGLDEFLARFQADRETLEARQAWARPRRPRLELEGRARAGPAGCAGVPRSSTLDAGRDRAAVP